MERIAGEAAYAAAQELESQLCRDALLRITDTAEDNQKRQQVRELYLQAAAAGHVRGQAHAAVCYAYCIGGPRDAAEHQRLVNAAADAGDPLALAMRAENFWFGENGFPQDVARCAEDAEKSWQGRSWVGGTILTWTLKKKAEDAKEEEKEQLSQRAQEVLSQSFPILSELAHKGDSIAQDWLAWRYYNGEGTEKDAKHAAVWFRKSAEQGLAWAQQWLGIRYINGDGVDRDLAEAERWLNKAIAQGIEESRAELERLRQQQN